MSDIEKRLRDTFDEIHAPENLKAKTLAAIEEARINQACTSEEECAVERERADKKEHAAITENRNMASTAIANRAASAERAASTERIAGADHTSNTNHAASKKQGASAQSPQASVIHAEKRFHILSSMRTKIALAACAVLIALGIGGGAYVYNTPSAYVGIDINPSIELGVNCFDYVVSAEGVNEDGATLLSQTSLTGMRYEDAIQALDDALEASGYLTNDAAVSVTVAGNNNDQCSHLESASQNCFESAGQGVHCSRVTEDEHREAHETGLGMGKYQVWRALNDAGVNISADEVATMTMSELRSLAAEKGVSTSSEDGVAPDTETGDNSNQSGHHGNGEYEHHGGK